MPIEPILDPDKILMRAQELADECGCRRWQTHRGMAVWQLEEEMRNAD